MKIFDCRSTTAAHFDRGLGLWEQSQVCSDHICSRYCCETSHIKWSCRHRGLAHSFAGFDFLLIQACLRSIGMGEFLDHEAHYVRPAAYRCGLQTPKMLVRSMTYIFKCRRDSKHRKDKKCCLAASCPFGTVSHLRAPFSQRVRSPVK